MRDPNGTVTRLAVLGELALRDWSAYGLVRSMRRTLHWFWPRAESGIYAEAQRLAAEGLVVARREPAATGSTRERTVYSITERGRSRLRRWLRTPPETVQFFIEPFLRIHLAREGTLADLQQSVAVAESVADDLLATAVSVAEEFLAGTHPFQADVVHRGLLFDGLWAQGLALKQWAVASRRSIATWTDLDADEAASTAALEWMRACVAQARALGIRT